MTETGRIVVVGAGHGGGNLVAALRMAMSYERGLAPFSRRNATGTPAASVTTMVTFHLFLRASASAASMT